MHARGIYRGKQFNRRKEIYEELYPETKQGMRNGQTAKTAESAVLDKPSFVKDTSVKQDVISNHPLNIKSYPLYQSFAFSCFT